jgi:hypothetical protein
LYWLLPSVLLAIIFGIANVWVLLRVASGCASWRVTRVATGSIVRGRLALSRTPPGRLILAELP